MAEENAKGRPPLGDPLEDVVEPEHRVRCDYCRRIIHGQARVCPHCGVYRHFWDELNRPAVWLALLACLISVLSVGLAFEQLNDARAARLAERRADERATEAQDTSEDVRAAAGAPLGGREGFETVGVARERELLRRNFRRAAPVVVAALKEAFALKDHASIPFRWGGKSPSEGFDSSGFAAYVLARVGVLDKVGYRLYNTTRLKDSFPRLPAAQAQPGDLVLYRDGFVAFYLGEGQGIGIGNSRGIQVVRLDWAKAEGAYRWAPGR